MTDGIGERNDKEVAGAAMAETNILFVGSAWFRKKAEQKFSLVQKVRTRSIKS